MAKPKSEIPLTLHKLNLFEGDFAKMQTLFPTLGAGPAIRTIVRNFIKQVETTTAPLDIELPIDDLKELMNDQPN
jgi:hypothetical protein